MRNFLLSLFLCTACYCQAAEIRAILVCDTLAENIEKAVVSDLKNVQDDLKKIASKTGTKLVLQVFAQKNLKEPLSKYIKAINVKEDDVIIFYFSGHGYRTERKGLNQWPNLFLTYDKQALDFREIFMALKAKKAGLLIAFADCCNNILPDEAEQMVVPLPVYKSQKPITIKEQNLKRLFLKTKGTMIISGAKPGEFSWCTIKGGLFTQAFFQMIKEVSSHPKAAKWKTILDKASIKVAKQNNGQTPQFELNIQEWE